jgi:hypothetical protein
MVLRIEKHFKAEQAARKKAEELLQQAIAAEMDAKNKLEEVLTKRVTEQALLGEEREAIKRVGSRAWSFELLPLELALQLCHRACIQACLLTRPQV